MSDGKNKYYELLSERFHWCIDCGYIGGEGKAPYCEDCKEYWSKLSEAMVEAEEGRLKEDLLPQRLGEPISVTYCKDCRYYEKGECRNKHRLTHQYMVHPEEFCSRGARR